MTTRLHPAFLAGLRLHTRTQCALAVVPDKARFASLFVKRGLCPDLGGLYKLPKIVGY